MPAHTNEIFYSRNIIDIHGSMCRRNIQLTCAAGNKFKLVLYFIMKKALYQFWIVMLLTSPVFLTDIFAQRKQVATGTVQRIKVHGKFLEQNLSGDSAERYVSVYLPASYKNNPAKRYPVVYFLHGYTDNDAKFYGFEKHWMTLPPILDSVFAKDAMHEMIVVTPNAYTTFQGSMYSNSATTGNWEDFIAEELVAYIDSHFRTLAKTESRGLCGHSMGGYGALRRMYFQLYIYLARVV